MKAYCMTALWVLCFLLPYQAAVADETKDIPLSTRMALFNAQKLMTVDKYDEAAELLISFKAKSLKGRNISPDDPDGYGYGLVDFTIGNCLLMLEQTAKAMGFYAGVVRMRPDFHEAWMNLAKCQYDLNRHAPAGNSFLRAYDTANKEKPELLYYSAVSIMLSDGHQTARGVFERLLTAHPELVRLEWKETLVQIYLALEIPQVALPFIEELAEKSTGDKQKRWQEVLLYQYLSLEMKQKAMAYVKRLTAEYPLEPRWWKGQVHLYLQDNQYREALVAITVKELLTPLTDRELVLAGDLNLSLDMPTQSVKYYERYLARKLDPEVLIKTVQSHMHLNHEEQAMKWVDEGLQRWPDNRLFMLKGHLLYQRGKYRDAIPAFLAAANSRKKNEGEAWLMAGYASWYADDMAAAELAIVEALKFTKQEKAAGKLLAEIRKIRQQERKGKEP